MVPVYTSRIQFWTLSTRFALVPVWNFMFWRVWGLLNEPKKVVKYYASAINQIEIIGSMVQYFLFLSVNLCTPMSSFDAISTYSTYFHNSKLQESKTVYHYLFIVCVYHWVKIVPLRQFFFIIETLIFLSLVMF